MTRNGKIARLPREVRDALNRRLDNGEPGVKLVAWLNTLPEVAAALQAEFGGRPITDGNVSEWKSGGYLEWQARQEALAQARDLAADAQELSDATGGRLTNHLATFLAARYAMALKGWDGEPSEEFLGKLRVLQAVCRDIVELRKGDHSGARLSIEQQRLDREREKSDEEVADHFKRWAENPAVREWMCAKWARSEERDRRLREILGLPPKDPTAGDAPISEAPLPSNPPNSE